MSCDRYESMLPALAGGELDETSARDVRAHVDTCASCRRSLATFAALEAALVMRRAEVPPVDGFLPRVQPVSSVRPILRRVLNAVCSVPGLVSIGFVWAGILMLVNRDAVNAFVERSLNVFVEPSSLGRSLGSMLSGADGLDLTTLAAVYGAVTLLILLSTGWITARFIRGTR